MNDFFRNTNWWVKIPQMINFTLRGKDYDMMKNSTHFLKQMACAFISCAIVFTCSESVQAYSNPTTSASTQTEVASITSNTAFVYYVSNGSLYRVKSDGTKAQKLLSSFTGVELTPVENYLYYMYDERSTTLLRIPMDGSAKIASRFQSDVVYYAADGGYIYYMNDKGAIYRAPGNAKNASEAKLITDMADVNYPQFSIVDGRVYYNALKSGCTTWVASKAADGSGQVQWVAEGAIPSSWYVHTDNSSIYLMVNTKPEETRYSLDCMVLYSLPRKGGEAKAINPKAPIDTNAVNSGWWVNGYFIYNNGIELGSEDEYDYKKGQGFAIDINGNAIQLHNTGIHEAANVGTNKLVFVDADGKAFVSTINGSKVESKKELPISDAWYVRNLVTDGKVTATMLFANSGTYMLQSDLSLKKIVGVEWDLCIYRDDVPGFFFVNAGDNGRLYHMSSNGETSTKLCDEKVNRIVLISKP